MVKENSGFCSRFFSALANKSRVRILQELSVKSMSVNELASKVGIERTLVSHYLTLLSKAELVTYKKEGINRIYRANEEIVPHVFFLMQRVVCSGCSIRRACLALKERALPPLVVSNRPPCEGCM